MVAQKDEDHGIYVIFAEVEECKVFCHKSSSQAPPLVLQTWEMQGHAAITAPRLVDQLAGLCPADGARHLVTPGLKESQHAHGCEGCLKCASNSTTCKRRG